MTEPQNFITGTGRCGSTILSHMLMRHPEALVLREFFSTLDDRRFRPGSIDGEALASLLAADRHPVIPFLQRGGDIPEMRYRVDEAQGRQPHLRIPGLLLVALPTASHTPSVVYDGLLDWAREQPSRTLREHYPEAFSFLLGELGGHVCIEASATNNVDLDVFPNARVLHIHRSGPEVVLSMNEHRFFRLMANLALDPLSPADWETVWRREVDDDADPLVARMALGPSADFDAFFAKMWTSSLARNLRVLCQLPRDHVLELRFEDLLREPVETLLRAAQFFGLAPERRWAEEAATMLRIVELRLPTVDAQRQTRLSEACAIGQILAGREQRRRYDMVDA